MLYSFFHLPSISQGAFNVNLTPEVCHSRGGRRKNYDRGTLILWSGGIALENFLGNHALWSFRNAKSEHTETSIAFILKT